MGNYKFRLSDMMPNAWFYKLRDMGKTRTHSTSHPLKKKLPSPATTTSQKPHLSQPRHSKLTTRADKFYNSPQNPKASDTHFPDPPRKSSNKKRKSKRKSISKPPPRLVTSSVSSDCSCRSTLNSVWTKPEPTQTQDYFFSSSCESSPEPGFHESPLSEFESNTIDDDAPESFNGLASWSTSSCRVTSSTTDIIIDMNEKSYSRNTINSEHHLPPILTKPVKFNNYANSEESSKFEEIEARGSLSIKIVKEDTKKTQKETQTSSLIRKSASYSKGVKLQLANSPKIANKKVQAYGRRSVSSKSQRRSISESFAIVKSSFDPQRDFKESMVEMIAENNIRASKDLEELLACYLSLNSDEYHELIVKTFEQIWFDMAHLRM